MNNVNISDIHIFLLFLNISNSLRSIFFNVFLYLSYTYEGHYKISGERLKVYAQFSFNRKMADSHKEVNH